MEKAEMTKATLGRLPHYLQLLRELSPDDVPYISATVIAKKLSLGEVLVRKDLSVVSGAGKPKVGYKTVDLIKSIEAHLGQGDMTNAVLVGAGKLGKALLEFDDFEDYGVKIIAAFDCNQNPIKVTILRNGREVALEIELDEKPQDTGSPAPSAPQPEGTQPGSGSYEDWYKYFFGPFFGE